MSNHFISLQLAEEDVWADIRPDAILVVEHYEDHDLVRTTVGAYVVAPGQFSLDRIDCHMQHAGVRKL